MTSYHPNYLIAMRKSNMAYKYEPQTLSGKAIVLTGGTTGIGRATAQRLIMDGARILIFGRHEKELQEALEDIRSVAGGNGEAHGIIADSAKPEDVTRVFEEADRVLGGVDILINNAALAAQSILDSDYEEWHEVIHTNIVGYLNCSRHALDRMIPHKTGHILNIGSLSAKVREAGSDVYVATKSAIEGFSESLRRQVNEKGIKVSLIEPGLVGTEMTVDQVPKEDQSRAEAEGKMLLAEDLAECVRYCLIQPQRCDIILIQIRPSQQII